MVLRWLIVSSFVLLFASNTRAQQDLKKFVLETSYLVALPDHYGDDTTIRWPLLMFLHGSGESGNDIEKVKVHGPPQLIAQGMKFPFIVVSPQSDVPSGWDVDLLYKLLQELKRNYRVDNRRIYLTGLSMGGSGTWAMAMKYPEEFAAIAPICGRADTTTAWKIRNLAVWCFHGALDDVVPPSESINMVKAVSRYNPNIQFTLYPDKNHNSWDTTYLNDSLYGWLLSQSKFMYKEIPVPERNLKKYTGLYVGNDNDSVQILIQGRQLIANHGKDHTPLKAAQGNVFFLQPDRNIDIRFLFWKNKITGLLFSGDRQFLYRKI